MVILKSLARLTAPVPPRRVPGHPGDDLHWLWLPNDLPAEVRIQCHRIHPVHGCSSSAMGCAHEGIPPHGGRQDQVSAWHNFNLLIARLRVQSQTDRPKSK